MSGVLETNIDPIQRTQHFLSPEISPFKHATVRKWMKVDVDKRIIKWDMEGK